MEKIRVGQIVNLLVKVEGVVERVAALVHKIKEQPKVSKKGKLTLPVVELHVFEEKSKKLQKDVPYGLTEGCFCFPDDELEVASREEEETEE